MTKNRDIGAEQVKNIAILYEQGRIYARETMRGIYNYSTIQGNWRLFMPTTEYILPRTQKESTIHFLKQLNPDGIIVPGSNRQLKSIVELGKPIIVHRSLNERFKNVPFIVGTSAIGEIAAEHLLNKGLKNFAYVGISGSESSIERRDGFVKKIRECLNLSDIHLFEQNEHFYKRETGEILKDLCTWAKDLPKPIGIMTQIDELAQMVARACRMGEIIIPDEVAIIGVDNDPLICEFTTPPLSSVALANEKAGFLAAELLDRLIDGKEKPNGQTIIAEPTHVVERRSTDILSIEDKDVLAAVRFIKEQCHRPLDEMEICETTGISRRNLELKFQKHLNCTLKTFTDRQRTERITQMLIETNLPMAQIAYTVGFSGPEKLSRFFKRTKGTCPHSYRKKHALK
ncbi:MAG: XylR family transcriptional regulator [Planctomycetota bacterium]|jgi:LacI family transcriptional regulator